MHIDIFQQNICPTISENSFFLLHGESLRIQTKNRNSSFELKNAITALISAVGVTITGCTVVKLESNP